MDRYEFFFKLSLNWLTLLATGFAFLPFK